MEGSSCSLNTSPQNYYYNYGGNTTSLEYTKTIIYHTSSPNLTTDASVSAFSSLFDANGITSASLATAQTDFSINFIGASSFIGTFDPMTAIQASAVEFQPSVSFVVNSYVKGTYKVTVSNMVSNIPTAVYFVLVSYKNITTNQISSTTTITIKPLAIPSAEQVASCVDGGDYPAVQCRRVMLLTGTTYSFDFSSLVENSVYAVHYVYANEFPQRPIFYGAVQTKYIFTTNWEPHTGVAVVMVLLLLSLFL